MQFKKKTQLTVNWDTSKWNYFMGRAVTFGNVLAYDKYKVYKVFSMKI